MTEVELPHPTIASSSDDEDEELSWSTITSYLSNPPFTHNKPTATNQSSLLHLKDTLQNLEVHFEKLRNTVAHLLHFLEVEREELAYKKLVVGFLDERDEKEKDDERDEDKEERDGQREELKRDEERLMEHETLSENFVREAEWVEGEMERVEKLVDKRMAEMEDSGSSQVPERGG